MTPSEFWQSCKRLPEHLPPAVPAAIPALLIKKGGDFPAFWPSDHSFIGVMEALYQAIRNREKDW
jgi:uncharacterized Zn finger protein